MWYSLGFVESVQGVRAGDVVWQIGFGSGFKCNSAVWRALRPIATVHEAWKHVQGREGEALATLLEVGGGGAAPRPPKEAAAGREAANGHADGSVAVDAAPRAAEKAKRPAGGSNGQQRGQAQSKENDTAGARRTLRSGRVVAN